MSSPRDLPGFYYDAERNRYFPVSFRGVQNQKRGGQGRAFWYQIMAGPSTTSTFMANKRTFSDVLTSPSPKSNTKPSQWEKYLIDQINHLQQSNQDLHNELNKAKQHIQQLEEQMDIKVKQAANTTATESNQNELMQENTGHFKDDCKSSPNVEAKVLQILSKREIGVGSRLGNSCTSSTFKREYLETQAFKPRIWSYGAYSCSDGAVEEFYAQIQTNEGLKGASVVTWGNSNGVVGVFEALQSSVSKKGNVLKPEQIFPQSGVPMLTDVTCPPDLKPSSMVKISSSKITAIRKLSNISDVDDGSLIFTTLGSEWEGGAIYLLNQRQVYDGSWCTGQPLPLEMVKCVVTDCSVWTTAYCAPDKATLGTSKGAALAHLERSSLRWLVHSKSDVLSQQCDLTGNLLFCGFRNGYISMVDIRSAASRPRRMPLMQTRPEASLSSSSSSSFLRDKNALLKEAALKNVHSRQKKVPFRDKAAEVAQNFCETLRMNSAICSLRLLQSDETYLLASAVNGDINLWDRRLVEKGPVLTYEGNQNSHSLIGLGVDASESLLASGSEDRAIRIWSLRSGKLLQTISGLPVVVHSFSSTSQFQSDPSIQDSHAWKMWLGSSGGLMYMHGSAANLE